MYYVSTRDSSLRLTGAQALYSYSLRFCFTTDGGILSYLDGRSFRVEDVDFVHEYFP